MQAHKTPGVNYNPTQAHNGVKETQSLRSVREAEEERRSRTSQGNDLDLSALDVPAEPKKDAGIEAREKVSMREKAYRTWRAVKIFTAGFLGIFLLLAAAYGYYQWQNRVIINETVSKSCSVKIGGGDTQITGTRTATYQLTEVLGYQFRDKSKIMEQTRINITGTPMTIVGITGKDIHPVHVGLGEKYNQLVPVADKYIFTLDNKSTVMVDYQTFCR